MTGRKPAKPSRAEPVSLAPLSFEEAVRALAATPPMAGGKPPSKRQTATRRKPKRKIAK